MPEIRGQKSEDRSQRTEVAGCDWERLPEGGGVQCRRAGCGNKLSGPDSWPLTKFHATCWALDPERKGIKEQREKMARARETARNPGLHPCIHQGGPTGESVECGGCSGGWRALFGCEIYGVCLPLNVAAGIHCCFTCDDYEKME